MPDIDLDLRPEASRTMPGRPGQRPRGLFRKSLAVLALAGRANRPIAEIATKHFPRGVVALIDGAAVLRSGVGVTHDPTLRTQLLVEFSNAFALGGWTDPCIPSYSPADPPLSAPVGATGAIRVVAPRIGAARLPADKCAGFCGFSRELEAVSGNQIETILEAALLADIGMRVDMTLTDDRPATEIRPVGLRYGVAGKRVS
jgi:hypothetical protein